MTPVALRYLLVAVAAGGLGELGARTDALVFHVDANTHRTRRIEMTSDLALVSMKMSGDDDDDNEDEPEAGMRSHDEQSFVVRDVFETVAAGQPRKVRRTFEKLSASEKTEDPDDAEGSDEETLESKLEGTEVVFTWDEDEQKFEAAFAEGKTGEASLLSALDEDMDLRALLPAGEVSPGDEWQFELQKDLLSPGGDLRLASHDEEADAGATDDQLRDNHRSKVTATYKGTVTKDGAKLATIHLHVESTSSAEDNGSEGGGHMEQASTLDGDLLWDPAHGHARSLTLQGELHVGMRQSLEFDQKTLEVTSEFAGTVHFEMQLEDD